MKLCLDGIGETILDRMQALSESQDVQKSKQIERILTDGHTFGDLSSFSPKYHWDKLKVVAIGKVRLFKFFNGNDLICKMKDNINQQDLANFCSQ